MNPKHLSSSFVLAGALSLAAPLDAEAWAPKKAPSMSVQKCNPQPTAKTRRFNCPSLIFRAIVPTSERVSQTWKYSFTAPPSTWRQKGFNDSKWRTGRGGFGTKGTPGIGKLGTVWNTRDIWLRRTFNPGKLTAAQINRIGLRYYHDDAVEIYINGAPVFIAGGYTPSYQNRPFFPLANRIIPNATNVIAVHCRQTGGGQYIDVGLQEIILR